uniref:Malic enzyme n=1 Tax=Aegilops tauschii subsp. strangulata TaxID=200361 RepID=A0A453E6C8_AEGTS
MLIDLLCHSGYTLLRDPHHNKGLAFTERERDAHYLRGLLPPGVVSQDLQVKKIMHNLRQYKVPLQRYVAMMDLQERNERLFYKLLIDNVEELLPVVYTPTVGEACQKYGSIFRRPQGLYVSLRDKGKVIDVLRNWPERNIQVIVVTDGERILGLGDLGCQGMGIPVGKLSLYTALGGVRPSACLPITIDVGTNNEQLLNDEFYIGLRQRRATGEEYHELMEEFMDAVKQIYGEKVLIQFEDFANHNAFDLLAKYSKSHLVFNDDIQGTASVGLIVSSRKNSLQPFKTSWAHEREPVTTLLDAIKRPVIFSLSNPTSHSECTAEEAYKWTQGRAVFASGSPFDPVEYDGKIRVPGQANNAYIFPGFGLGVVISGAIRVHEDMLLAASETLAAQATQENFDKGSIFPPFTNIRKISALIAASVAAKAYELGLATRLPRPRDLEKYAESCMYTPVYRSYR